MFSESGMNSMLYGCELVIDSIGRRASGPFQHALSLLVLRVQTQGLAEFRCRLREATTAGQSDAIVQMSVGEVGLEAHGFGKLIERFRFPPEAGQRAAQLEVNFCHAGALLQRDSEIRDG